jgi:galactonate dehydratase
MLLKKGAASFVRPDVCLCGGITGMKKIAAMAEATQVGVIPHNPLGPVCAAASLQVSAVIPNLAIQESGVDVSQPPLSEVFRADWRVENGYLTIPETPGIGIELMEGAEDRILPSNQGATDGRPLVTRLHTDGSIMDQ